MKQPTLGNPQNTIEVLQKYQFTFQKKFGQNFLIDTHVLDKVIRAAEITKDDMVLEIGPGIGTMTQYLSCAAGKVTAVEIDKTLIPILEDTLEFLADRSAAIHTEALPGGWDGEHYTLTDDSHAAVQTLFNVSPTEAQLSSASEP